MFLRNYSLSIFNNALIASLIYSIIFHLPLALSRISLSTNFHGSSEAYCIGFIEFFIALFFTFITFFLLSLSRYLYIISLPVFFCLGAISDYYIYNFGKTFDIGVLQDILSVETDLTHEYISLILIISTISSLILSCFFLYYKRFNFKKYISLSLIAFITASYIFVTYLDFKKQKLYINRIVPQSYMPFSLFYNIDIYLRKHGAFSKSTTKKTNLTENYSFNFKKNSNAPKIVVLVIGESMRGDLLYLNGNKEYQNTPELSKVKNLISFKGATSSATSTRISLPYMLTRALAGNWEQAISEKSIISIFKSLGFKTAWIGAQGAFAKYDYTYGPIIMEADYIITKADIRKDSGQGNIYDEYLLPYLDKFVKANKSDDMFIVLHMMGSHWHFNERYPAEFKKFNPTCTSSSPASCERKELLNSYHNTILYSDWVLSQIIQKLENEDTFLLFASDHGFSLFERNYFGNAYEGKDELKEQYDIAMMAWASERYTNNQQGFFDKLKNQTKASHDNLFHSLLGCSGVESEIIVNDLNFCSIVSNR